jgi:hypothetical protein
MSKAYYVVVGRKEKKVAGRTRIVADVEVYEAALLPWSSRVKNEGYLTRTTDIFEVTAASREDAKNLVILHLLGDAPMVHRVFTRNQDKVGC